jgi:NAD(P)-dependent dehydrogenase (short-subunit alcohol dehydrogenase family)
VSRQAPLSQAAPQAGLAAFRLDGQLALVTGASRGIGRGCALALAGAGADIALIGRSRPDLEAAAGEIESVGRQAHLLACDITQSAKVREALDRLPRIDILVNNAGANVPQGFLDVDEATFDRLFTLNMKAAFFLAQEVARRMLQQKIPGSIINMSSQAGHVALPDRSVYCSTKHALEGFSKAIAVELAPFGIRVNTVAPTFIETPMTQKYLTGAFAGFALERIPLGRLGHVEDVVGAVLYLAAPASGLVTGTCLRVDGGWTAQ